MREPEVGDEVWLTAQCLDQYEPVRGKEDWILSRGPVVNDWGIVIEITTGRTGERWMLVDTGECAVIAGSGDWR